MTTDNEALKLANSVPELQSLLYDVDLMPEQLDPTGFGYRRMLAIVEAYKVGIQTGRDQMQKELAEIEPVGWMVRHRMKCQNMSGWRFVENLDKAMVHISGSGLLRDFESYQLITQPTMPKKGE